MSSKGLKDKALILDIQRLSTEDGPGIRTTVFFKGCTLQCLWCHNPESIYFEKQIEWLKVHCIDCKNCIQICPESALTFNKNGLEINRDKCSLCLRCSEVCPTGAIEVKGEEWLLRDLLYEVLKDKIYFDKSGGGVTLSGGDPLAQIDFVVKFLSSLKEQNIHTAVDTAGLISRKSIEAILPKTDLILYDLKLYDEKFHKKYTGSSNKIILENIRFINDYIKINGKPMLWIRTPIIPGATDTIDNISAIGSFIAGELSQTIKKWELCAFNNLCRDKYNRLGLEWVFNKAILLSQDKMEQLTEVAKNSGVDSEIVLWSGSIKKEV